MSLNQYENNPVVFVDSLMTARIFGSAAHVMLTFAEKMQIASRLLLLACLAVA